MVKLSNILFDWSGTLFNDVKNSYLSTRHTIRHFGGPHLSFEEYRTQFDLPVWKFYRQHIHHVSIDEIDRYYFNHFSHQTSGAQLFPGVIPVLRKAKEAGYRLFIFSTVRQDLLEELAYREKIAPFFEEIIGSVRDKERSLPFVCRKHRLKRDQTLFIGDMEHDLSAARKSGILSGAFLSGYHDPSRLLKRAPDFVWNHYDDLLKFLNSLEKIPTPKKGLPPSFPIPTVGALIFNRGDIFLIQTHKWGHTFGIPGGKIHYGEPMRDALVREIQEETGLTLKKIRWALIQDSINSQEFYKARQHFLLLNFYAESTSRSFQLNDEAESGIWVNPHGALKLNLNQPTRLLIQNFLAS